MEESFYGQQFVQKLNTEYQNAKNAYLLRLEAANKTGAGIVAQVYSYMLPIERYLKSINLDFAMVYDDNKKTINFKTNIFDGHAQCDIFINKRIGSYVVRWVFEGNELIHTCCAVKNGEIIGHHEIEEVIAYNHDYPGVLDKIQPKIQKIIVHAAETGIL